MDKHILAFAVIAWDESVAVLHVEPLHGSLDSGRYGVEVEAVNNWKPRRGCHSQGLADTYRWPSSVGALSVNFRPLPPTYSVLLICNDFSWLSLRRKRIIIFGCFSMYVPNRGWHTGVVDGWGLSSLRAVVQVVFNHRSAPMVKLAAMEPLLRLYSLVMLFSVGEAPHVWLQCRSLPALSTKWPNLYRQYWPLIGSHTVNGLSLTERTLNAVNKNRYIKDRFHTTLKTEPCHRCTRRLHFTHCPTLPLTYTLFYNVLTHNNASELNTTHKERIIV